MISLVRLFWFCFHENPITRPIAESIIHTKRMAAGMPNTSITMLQKSPVQSVFMCHPAVRRERVFCFVSGKDFQRKPHLCVKVAVAHLAGVQEFILCRLPPTDGFHKQLQRPFAGTASGERVIVGALAADQCPFLGEFLGDVATAVLEPVYHRQCEA